MDGADCSPSSAGASASRDITGTGDTGRSITRLLGDLGIGAAAASEGLRGLTIESFFAGDRGATEIDPKWL